MVVSFQNEGSQFANKGPSSQGYGFSSSHLWTWELDCEESWVPKNWCFWTVVLEKTLEGYKEIQLVHSKGDQSWVFFGKTDAKANSSTLATSCEVLTHWKRHWCWEGLRAGGEGDNRAWHHRLNGHGFGWTLAVDDGQEGLACCGSWDRKESDTTEQLNWTQKYSLQNYMFLIMENCPILYEC